MYIIPFLTYGIFRHCLTWTSYGSRFPFRWTGETFSLLVLKYRSVGMTNYTGILGRVIIINLEAVYSITEVKLGKI